MKKSVNISEKLIQKFDKELLSLISSDLKADKKVDNPVIAQIKNIRAAKLVA